MIRHENAIASVSEAALGHVQEFEREVFHARAELANCCAEVVVEHGRRNRRGQVRCAVAISASEMPGATARRLALPACAKRAECAR